MVPVIWYHLKDAPAQAATLTVFDAAGKVVATCRRAEGGLHRAVWNLQPDGQKGVLVAAGKYSVRPQGLGRSSAFSGIAPRRLKADYEPKAKQRLSRKRQKQPSSAPLFNGHAQQFHIVRSPTCRPHRITYPPPPTHPSGRPAASSTRPGAARLLRRRHGRHHFAGGVEHRQRRGLGRRVLQ